MNQTKPHRLEGRLRSINRRVRRYRRLAAVSRLVALVVLVAGAWCLVDYALHIQDQGLRWIASLVTLAVAGWAVWRYLRPAFGTSTSDLALALELEKHHSPLANRLASALEFLSQDENDPRAGSAELRRRVVEETSATADSLPLESIVDPRPSWRWAAQAAVVVLVAGALVACDPADARRAVARLVRPWGGPAWPQANHLDLYPRVARIAARQTFEVEVVDTLGARIPDDVRVHYRYDDLDQTRSIERPTFLDGKHIARKEDVTRPFSYGVEGGDDRTIDWIRLEVVEPPAVEDVTVTMHPPAHTGWSSYTTDERIEGLVDTRIELTARSTKPLVAARIRIEGEPPIAAEIGEDKQHFKVPAAGATPFVIERSSSWRLDLEDELGFHGGQDVAYELRAVADTAPTVTIDDPPGQLQVTASAVVPLVISAKDDLALAGMSIHYMRSDKSQDPHVSIAIYQGPPQPPRVELTSGMPRLDGDARKVEHRLELSELELAPGTEITVQAMASDYRPSVGESTPRLICIVAPEELAELLAQRQDVILSELGRMLGLTREARGQTNDVQIQLEQVGSLTPADADQLQTAELTQRQVERGLTSPREGVAAQIESLLADLDNNRLDNPDMRRRMESLSGRIGELEQQNLPIIKRELTNAVKGSRSLAGKNNSETAATGGEIEQTKSSLAAATDQLDKVIESLEQALGDLAEWDAYRRFHRETSELLRDQVDVRKQTTEVAKDTVSRDLDDLSPQERTNLNKLAGAQNELARRFEKLQQRLGELAQDFAQTDPLAGDALADAEDHARRQGLAARMRQAGSQLGQNQVSQAGQEQEGVTGELREMLDILTNRREDELERLVKQLREAESRLSEIEKQQEGLRKQADQAAREENPAEKQRQLERLSRQQRQLAEETQRLARQLRRLRAQRAGSSLARSGQAMSGAAAAGEGQDAESAGHQAEAAERDLEQAQEELAQDRRQAEMDLAAEQLARLEDGVKSLIERQSQVRNETEQIDERRLAAELTRPQLATLGGLTRQQRSLAGETHGLAEKLRSAAAFEAALSGAAGEMDQAALRLAERSTDQSTRDAQVRAGDRLKLVLDALGNDENQQKGQEGGEEQPGDQGQGQGQSNEPSASLAELKLLKLMQSELQRRTQAIEDASAKAGGLSEADRQELTRLSAEQGQLADLLINLARQDGEGTVNEQGMPDENIEAGETIPQEGRPVSPEAATNDERTPIGSGEAS